MPLAGRLRRRGGDLEHAIDRGLKSWRSAYYGSNYKRLRKVKRRYDPDWLLKFPQGIAPA